MGISRDVEVCANVLASLAHGLQAVSCILVGVNNLVDERSGESVAARAHRLCTDGKTALDRASDDLVSDVLDGLEAGAAEAIHRASSRGGWEASGKCGGADVVGGLGIRDLCLVSAQSIGLI